MPRKLRVEYPGAMYHVMSRGDRREDIFLNDVDRQDFIKTLAESWFVETTVRVTMLLTTPPKLDFRHRTLMNKGSYAIHQTRRLSNRSTNHRAVA
jgi:REP element-mobilizing transposase RayT